MVHFGDTVFGIDSIIHSRLETDVHKHAFIATSPATYSESVSDDQAPDDLLIIVSCPVEHPPPEQGPDLMSSFVTTDNATFTTFSSL